MRDTLYRQMVYWIREYRTWIEVVDDNFYKEYALSRNGYINYIVSRTLVLRACKDKGSYAKGMTWTIPEHKLDKALAAYRKQEHTFKQRIKKAAIYLSPRDAEVIILLATHNIVQLELMISPFKYARNPIIYDLEYTTTYLLYNAFRIAISIVQKPPFFMVRFYDAMIHSVKARKLYVQVVLILLLLFHYVYISGHVGEFGVFFQLLSVPLYIHLGERTDC